MNPQTAIANKILGIVGQKGKVVKASSLFEVLDGIKGAKFLSLVTVTEPDLTGGKSGPFYDKVVRIANPTGQINFSYENAVNNSREREGKDADFTSGETWYTVVTDPEGRITPWARHKKTDELYLRYRQLQTGASYYLDKFSGLEIPVAELEPFMKKRSGGRQELENEVKPRVIKLENVKSVVIDGTVFVTP